MRGGRGQEFDGIAVLERSRWCCSAETALSACSAAAEIPPLSVQSRSRATERTVPTAVVEVVDPIVLGCRVMEPCDCACIPEGRPGDIPESIAACLSRAACLRRTASLWMRREPGAPPASRSRPFRWASSR